MYEVIWKKMVDCHFCNGQGIPPDSINACRPCKGTGREYIKESHTVSEATSGDCYSDELMGTQPGDDWALDEVVEIDPLDINDDGWER